MATQNPNRLGTNCPGGSLTLGGDTTVNRLGFGAMRLCGPGVWGEPLDRPGAKRVLTRAVELGITLIDTADAYGPEVNERFIAETLYPYPKGLITRRPSSTRLLLPCPLTTPSTSRVFARRRVSSPSGCSISLMACHASVHPNPICGKF